MRSSECESSEHGACGGGATAAASTSAAAAAVGALSMLQSALLCGSRAELYFVVALSLSLSPSPLCATPLNLNAALGSACQLGQQQQGSRRRPQQLPGSKLAVAC